MKIKKFKYLKMDLLRIAVYLAIAFLGILAMLFVLSLPEIIAFIIFG